MPGRGYRKLGSRTRILRCLHGLMIPLLDLSHSLVVAFDSFKERVDVEMRMDDLITAQRRDVAAVQRFLPQFVDFRMEKVLVAQHETD